VPWLQLEPAICEQLLMAGKSQSGARRQGLQSLQNGLSRRKYRLRAANVCFFVFGVRDERLLFESRYFRYGSIV